MHIHTRSQLDRIEREYNPEFDIPEDPQVTWVSFWLREAIIEQQQEIDELKQAIDKLVAVIRLTTASINDDDYLEWQDIEETQNDAMRGLWK